MTLTDKIIPESIQAEAEKALSYFPELANTPIQFRFKDRIKKSTMQAQPLLSSFFKSREHRQYVILLMYLFAVGFAVKGLVKFW